MNILIYDKDNKIADILEYKFKDQFNIISKTDFNSFQESYFNSSFEVSIVNLEISDKIDFNKLCKKNDTKIIVMVSIDNEQLAEDAISLGCFAMIHSPVNAEEIETTLQAIIRY